MTDDLLRSMRQRLADAEADAAALRAAITVLKRDDDPPARASAPRWRARASDDRDARTVAPLGTLLTAVGDHPGQTNSWLAKHTGGEQSQLLVLLKEAEADGQLRRSGERRGTRWWIADAAALTS